MTLAPIILFTYNRLWHLQQTVDALKINELADKSDLFIFSDGSKNNYIDENIVRVRAYLCAIKGFRNIVIVERDENYGLAKSIISGVTEIVNRYKKIIVLEDDIVTSPGFLRYMNDALKCYQDNPQVMHISGYMFPVKAELEETFFYNTATCWGWGTWSRAWKYFNPDAKDLAKCIRDLRQISRFNIENTYDFYGHLKANVDGCIKTWAVKWYASLFINNGLSLHPKYSLTQNIGHDNSGVHCNSTDVFAWPKLAEKIAVRPIAIEESVAARKAMQKFNKSMKIAAMKVRLSNLLRKILRKTKKSTQNK